MKILSSNCEGLGNKEIIGYLRDLWKQHRPDFFFISETNNVCRLWKKIHLTLFMIN